MNTVCLGSLTRGDLLDKRGTSIRIRCPVCQRKFTRAKRGASPETLPRHKWPPSIGTPP